MSGLKTFLRHCIHKAKVCLFIDGLDEFDGNHEEIIGFLRNITCGMEQNAKVCVSSRPWSIFEKAFREIPSLKLQDLTFGDMVQRVIDELSKDARMRRLIRKEPNDGVNFIQATVETADGVFLLVKLAVQILLTDVTSCGNTSDVRSRLELPPRDLDDLFRHIPFNRLSQSYLKEAS